VLDDPDYAEVAEDLKSKLTTLRQSLE